MRTNVSIIRDEHQPRLEPVREVRVYTQRSDAQPAPLVFYRDDAPSYIGVRVPGFDATWVSLTLAEAEELACTIIDMVAQKKERFVE